MFLYFYTCTYVYSSIHYTHACVTTPCRFANVMEKRNNEHFVEINIHVARKKCSQKVVTWICIKGMQCYFKTSNNTRAGYKI